jgi:hypothetical protein
VNPAFIRVFAGKSDLVDVLRVGFGVEPFDRFERDAFEFLFAFGRLVENFLKRLPLPAFFLILRFFACFF